MNSAAFLSAVKQEIARLQQIQSLLENESVNVTSAGSTKATSGKRGGMSEAGKARVAEAQRKRWAAKKAAATAATHVPAIAKEKTSAPVKKAAKTGATVAPSKKQTASTSKPAANKTAATVKKRTVKKPAVTTKPAATKKALRKQPGLEARAEATEANAPGVDAAPAVTEDSSS